MRLWHYLFALAVLAGAARAGNFAITPMPAGGVSISGPGFSLRSPGQGWNFAGNIKPENGVLYSGAADKLFFSRGESGSGGEFSIQILGWPTGSVETIDPQRYLQDRYLRGEKPSALVHIGLTDEIVNGASCAVLRREYGPFPQTGALPKTIYGGHWVCAHPDMPGFWLELQFGTSSAQAAEDIAASVATLRFAPVSYRVRQIRTGWQIGRLVEADGALWTTSNNGSVLDGHGSVLRIDPATNSVVKTIEIGPQPQDIAVAAAQVWVGSFEGKMVRIDPKTNAITATLALAGHPLQILSSGGFVWVLTLDAAKGVTLVRIDPVRAKVVQSTPFGIAVCVEAGRWFFAHDIQTHEWLRLDGKTGAVVDGFQPQREIADISYDGRFAWLLQKEDGGTALLKFDPEHPATPERVRHLDGAESDPVWWNGELCTQGFRTVRCRAAGNGPAKDIPRWFGLQRLTVFDGSLWFTTADSILRVDPK